MSQTEPKPANPHKHSLFLAHPTEPKRVIHWLTGALLYKKRQRWATRKMIHLKGTN